MRARSTRAASTATVPSARLTRSLAAAGVALLTVPLLGATAEPTPAPPARTGLPPATAQVDVAPMVELVAPTASLVAPVNDLLARTASTDGAVAHDAGSERERWTLAGDVFFESDSADLTVRARTDLAEVAEDLAAAEVVSLTVVGHTDSVDTDAYNDALSQERATAVRDVLTQALPSTEITAEGRGEREPVADEQGSTDEVAQARALNRRVEITAVLEVGADG